MAHANLALLAVPLFALAYVTLPIAATRVHGWWFFFVSVALLAPLALVLWKWSLLLYEMWPETSHEEEWD